MPATDRLTWNELDEPVRRELERRYLAELSDFRAPGLTEEGLRAYLDYRRERGQAGITTYEEGQIRRLLRRHCRETTAPDPADSEEHLDALEVFGARTWHLTNCKTYVTVMVLLTLGFVLALFFYLHLI